MRPIIDGNQPVAGLRTTCWLLLTVMAAGVALVYSSTPELSEDDQKLRRELEEHARDKELSPEQLSDMMEKFGREIGGLMSDNIDKILEEEKKRTSTTNSLDEADELERIGQANHMVAKDAEARIAAAGRASTGEMAEFSLSDAYASGKDFYLNKVNSRLQQAGSFIGSQLSSVANMAPKLKAKLRKAPSALRNMLRWPTFFSFKTKFNKVYKSRSTELYRQMVFLKTQTKTAIHNIKFFLGLTKHLQKAGQYSDMTEEEYLQKIGVDSKLADDQSEVKTLSESQLAKLRSLRSENKNIYGTDMGLFLEKSKRNSPTEILARKQAAQAEKHRRRKRDSDELDDEDEEEGPVYSFKEDSDDDDDDDTDDMDIDENEGGNEEAAMLDEFADGFQNADLEAQMDAELDDLDEGDSKKINHRKQNEEDFDEQDDGVEFVPIDWTQHRCMAMIENQNDCGFCYALVASSMASFYHCMWSLKDDPDAIPTRLSARFVSDCGRYMWKSDAQVMIHGCNGGHISQAVRFLREAGAMNFIHYELQRTSLGIKLSEDRCVFPRPPSIKDFGPIKINYLQDTILMGVTSDDWKTVNTFLHAVGPVIVNVRPWEGFKEFAGGIIFNEKQRIPEMGVIHSMMIVGRDRDDKGRIYYKLRNSHGIP